MTSRAPLLFMTGTTRWVPLAFLWFVASSCRKTEDRSEPVATGSANPSVVAPSAPERPPAAEASYGRALPPTPPARVCRALHVEGDVRARNGGKIQTGDLLDGAPWLELGSDAKVTVKHARTSRELTFQGAGLIRPCYRDEEHFLVAEGELSTMTGAGARPGAEVVVSTPFGSLSYGDAGLVLEVAEKTATLSVRIGKAFLSEAGSKESPEEIRAGQRRVVDKRSVDVKSLVVECERAAAEAESRGQTLLEKGHPRPTLGKRAAEHLRARKTSRRACGVAAAAAARLEPPSEAAAMEDSIGRAEARWRRVPASPGPANQ